MCNVEMTAAASTVDMPSAGTFAGESWQFARLYDSAKGLSSGNRSVMSLVTNIEAGARTAGIGCNPIQSGFDSHRPLSVGRDLRRSPREAIDGVAGLTYDWEGAIRQTQQDCVAGRPLETVRVGYLQWPA